MKLPKVSVCIPTYNYGRYLPEAIESVLNQSYSEFELVIVDDASLDNTVRVVESYAAKDARIRFLCNQTNIGMVNNWNLCIREAKGDYIKFVFGDDVLTSPVALENMVRVLDSDDSISLVGSSRAIIDEKSKQIDIWSFYDSDIFVDGKEVINTCIRQLRNYIGEPTVVMFRKAQASRGFDIKYKQYVDLEMWFHLLEQGKYFHFKDPLSSFRLHGEQQTRKNEKTSASIDDKYNFYTEYFGRDYIKLSKIFKKYLIYENLIKTWNSSKKKKIITKAEALKRIEQSFGIIPFISFYPFYKICKPCFKRKPYLEDVRRCRDV